MSDLLKRYWWIAAILGVLLVMNGGGSPDDGDENDPLNARAAWCWTLATVSASPAPMPKPGPAPGDACENCNGRGKVGDGTVMVTCAVCGGTGRHPGDSGDEIAWEEFEFPDEPEEDEPQAVATYGDCSDGSCGVSGTRRVGFFRRVFGRR